MPITSMPPFDPAVLKQMRLRADLSMEALALEAGLSDKSQISRYEKGQSVPTAITLGKLLQALKPDGAIVLRLFCLQDEI